MIPPIVLPAMAAVALLALEAEVSGIVISLFSVTVVECVVAAVVLEVLDKTLEGHESALSSSKN